MGETAERRFSLFPKRLSAAVEQVIKPACKKHGFAEHRILTQWAEIVGPECASWSIPQKLTYPRGTKDGATLKVLVAAARALELQHMQPLILERIAAYFGHAAVARLTFVQAATPVFKKEQAKAPAREGVADPQLAALAQRCDDAELQQALLSLARAMDRR